MKHWAIMISLGVLTLTAVACGKTANNPSGTNSGGAPNGAATAVGTSATTAGGTSSGTNAASTVPESDVTKVVQIVRPAVVKVDASGQAQSTGPFGQPVNAQAQGTGTGILLDTQGHILTNNHVVTLESNAPASSIKVTLANGKSAPAKIVGRDDQTDLAVIQVGTGALAQTQPIQLADPTSIVVGEHDVAIGYALDLGGEPTVTAGVVSATDRSIDETNATISGAVQTDAAINPGNSGGPLVDMTGHLIGVNTAGLRGTPQEPAEGLNFAISVATARPVSTALIEHGQVTRGYMGVIVTDITPELAQSSSLPVDHGAGVVQVTPGSPAEAAGLQPGDIIVQVGSTQIHNTGDLTTALTNNGPGNKVSVSYYRGKDQHSADITLGTRPSTS